MFSIRDLNRGENNHWPDHRTNSRLTLVLIQHGTRTFCLDIKSVGLAMSKNMEMCYANIERKITRCGGYGGGIGTGNGVIYGPMESSPNR